MAINYIGNITEEQVDSLKNCPFCGQRELEVKISDKKFTDNVIRCKCCGGKMQVCMEYGVEKLIENWNSRA